MITNIIHIGGTPEDTYEKLLAHINERICARQAKGLSLNIALSGGETYRKFFIYLKKRYSDVLQWRFVRLFWADERCVPPTSKESNFGTAYETILKYTPLPDGNAFRMQGVNNCSSEDEVYAALLEKELPSAGNMPMLDLVLLGIGSDGHTASIFPDRMDLLDTEKATALSTHPETKQKRITLTGKIICNAADVCFLVTGKSKSLIIKQIADREDGYKKYPAAHIHSASGCIDFFLDKEAASGVSKNNTQ